MSPNRFCTSKSRWLGAALLSCQLVSLAACASPPPPAPKAAVVVPLEPAACGTVDVDDRTKPPSPPHALVVRDTLRQALAALGGCGPAYHLHVDLTLEPQALGRVRARLFMVVYGKGGALAGEIPTTVSGDRSSPDDVVATDALLRIGAQEAARAFTQNFH